MIDTDKYEGHPPAPWGWRHKVSEYRLTANGDKDWIDIQVDEDTDPTVMALIADAPKLLAEVKRLRKVMSKIGCSLCDECGLSIEEHIRYHTKNDVTGGCPFGED